jgi:hypothetical protein
MRSLGLHRGDVIVAIAGSRVHSFIQLYHFVLQDGPVPVQDLIVWQGNGYHEIKANPMLGESLGDYHAK